MLNIKRSFWAFPRNIRGNVAIIFGLSIMVIVAAVGGAVDFSRYTDARQQLQDASDAAVLRGALTASQGDTAASKAADQAFSENFSNDTVTLGAHTLARESSGTTAKLTYTATATMKPYFLGLLGFKNQTLNASSVAQSEVNPFELALVLDTTGSMASNNKMTYLKSSVTAVLSSLVDGSGNNSADVKVGVVPFNTQARMAVSTSYPFVDYTQCYLRTSVGYYACLTAWKAYQGVCAKATNATTCLATAISRVYYRTYTTGGITYYASTVMAYEKSGSKYNLFTNTVTTYIEAATLKMVTVSSNLTTTSSSSTSTWSSYAPSGYTSFSSSYLVSIANTWTGCLSDRNQAFDVSAAPYIADVPDSYYIAAACDYSTMKSILDLTTSISTAKTFVNSLTSTGNTNVTVGIQNGMELLSPDAPYTQGVAFGDADIAKYMIIVTDGDNTANRWTTSTSSINARTALACTAAKAKGITLFVVRVEDGDSSLLKACASKTTYYYDLSSASQLTATMADIFAKIGKLRIVQ